MPLESLKRASSSFADFFGAFADLDAGSAALLVFCRLVAGASGAEGSLNTVTEMAFEVEEDGFESSSASALRFFFFFSLLWTTTTSTAASFGAAFALPLPLDAKMSSISLAGMAGGKS